MFLFAVRQRGAGAAGIAAEIEPGKRDDESIRADRSRGEHEEQRGGRNESK